MSRKIDVALVCGCLLALAIELAARPELRAAPWSAAMVVVVAAALWFRRTHPLAATAAGFGMATLTTLVTRVDGAHSGLFILVLTFALCRHGNPRDIAVGAVFMVATYVASWSMGEMPRMSDMVGGAVGLALPAALGVAVRFRDVATARELAHAKLRERADLARELHDSVAHHVMAITLQAQAARARPEAASSALSAIEDEARRTLAELRSIVGALRAEDGGADRAPEGRIADVRAFARAGAEPKVVVELTGNLEGVPPVVERAVYRMAQESITNAVRHARGATRVDVRVEGDAESIRLTAEDDGTAPVRRSPGFGLVGMAERAALLGGTLEAGAGPRGFRVHAVLPRHGGRAR